tara:strand:+ start:878 stop:979 length:102 start_codon:yes stop_codon:yes gene_type:complete
MPKGKGYGKMMVKGTKMKKMLKKKMVGKKKMKK